MLANVLIVDDAESIHAMLRFQLQGEQLETRSAFSGECALRMVAEQRPDLVLLDVDLPDFDGFEVCRRIRENPFTMNVPIIFLTAADETSQKVCGLDLGACDYITKPFKSAELLARVRAALRAKTRLDMLSKQRVHEFFAEPLLPRNPAAGIGG
jgi:two-component system response regulator VicR